MKSQINIKLAFGHRAYYQQQMHFETDQRCFDKNLGRQTWLQAIDHD